MKELEITKDYGTSFERNLCEVEDKINEIIEDRNKMAEELEEFCESLQNFRSIISEMVYKLTRDQKKKDV